MHSGSEVTPRPLFVLVYRFIIEMMSSDSATDEVGKQTNKQLFLKPASTFEFNCILVFCSQPAAQHVPRLLLLLAL